MARNLTQPPPDEHHDWNPGEGFHIVWVDEEEDHWRVATEDEQIDRKCRRQGCQRAPVAALQRSNGWWLYCDWHLYGRRIRDGRVQGRRARRDVEEPVPA